MSTKIVLDTNIFLHYKTIDEICWEEIFSDKIEVVILPSVLREINHRKDSTPKNKVSVRAANALRKISSIAESPAMYVRQNISLLIFDKEKDHDWMSMGLSQGSPDDRIIAEVIHLKEEYPEDDVIIVTSDTGLLLMAKTKRHGLKAMRIDDKFKLLNEPTEEEIRIKILENQVRKLTDRMPDLRIQFSGSNNYLNWNFPNIDQAAVNSINDEAFQLSNCLKEISLERTPTITKNSLEEMILGFTKFAQPTEEVIEQYNKSIVNYRSAVEQTRKSMVELCEVKTRRIEMIIFLNNSGSAPASNIRIRLHYPDGFILGYRDDLKYPSWPSTPKKPMSAMERVSRFPINLNIPSHPYIPPVAIAKPNVFGKSIRETNSYDLNVEVRSLQHHDGVEIFSLYCEFSNHDCIQSFAVDWDIMCDELPDPVFGKLNVVIEK